MNCEQFIANDYCICRHCQQQMQPGEVRECPRGDYPGRSRALHAAQESVFTPDEMRTLFGEDDPSLLGNQIAALTKQFGFPPCGGCDTRREWINSAHVWLRSAGRRLIEKLDL